MRPSPRNPSLACDGALIGRVWIPPFEVRPGEIIKLVWESPELQSAESVLRAMCEVGPGTSMRTSGRVVPVELAMPRSRWREWLHRERSADWLVRRTGADRRAVDPRLRQLEIDPEQALSCLAGTPRWLLGLEFALFQDPAALLFHTSGLDPLGTQKALAAVARDIGESAGVYLATRSDLRIQEPDYTAVLTIRPGERQAVA